MDPLSDVLSLLKPQSYSAGGFPVSGDVASSFQSIRASSMPWSLASAGYLWKAFRNLYSSQLEIVSFCRVGSPSACRRTCLSRRWTTACFLKR